MFFELRFLKKSYQVLRNVSAKHRLIQLQTFFRSEIIKNFFVPYIENKIRSIIRSFILMHKERFRGKSSLKNTSKFCQIKNNNISRTAIFTRHYVLLQKKCIFLTLNETIPLFIQGTDI